MGRPSVLTATLELRRIIMLAALWSLAFLAVLAILISWQFAAVTLIVLAIIGSCILVAHLVARFAFPVLEVGASRSLQWLGARDHHLAKALHGQLAGFGAELPVAIILAVATMLGLWLFLGILEDVASGDPLVTVDRLVFRFLQILRNPAADNVLVAVTELGDRVVIVAVVAVAATAFSLLRRWRAAIYVLLSALGSAVFVHGMKLILHRARPLHLYDGLSEFSFPSGHATSSMVVYGFLAIMLARHAAPWLRQILIAGTLSLVSLIAFSRLYFGAHWLSDVGAGIAFGTAWIAVLSLAYFRQDGERLPAGALAAVCAASLTVAGVWHIANAHQTDLARYASPARQSGHP